MLKTTASRPYLAAFTALALFAAAAPASSDHGDCGQPVSSGLRPSAVDALRTLRASVGIAPCSLSRGSCVCDVDNSGRITARDALYILSSSVGMAVTLNCRTGCADQTSATSSTLVDATSSTTTSTSMIVSTSTTSSTSSSTSTTTMVAVTDLVQLGRLIYDGACSGCHVAGTYDVVGFAPDLETRGDLIVSDLGQLSGSMQGIVLTQTDIDLLRVFLVDLQSSTTSTTVSQGPLASGRSIYDTRCSTCHRAGDYDTRGFAGNIANELDDIRSNLGRIDSAMAGIILSSDEIADLRTFLSSLTSGSGGDEGDSDNDGDSDSDDGDSDNVGE